MRRILYSIIFCLFLFSGTSYPANDAEINIRGKSSDGTFTVMDSGIITKYFSQDPAAVQQQQITATASAFTAFTVPTNAKALLIDVGTVRGLRLKGITGDNGISLDNSCPVLIPVSDDGLTIGIQNLYGTDSNLKVMWF